ncbi:MAG: hypothetical protein LBD14_01110 [Puniceicoccales bacterium]|jgi:hypothetical protein|nr:hypothetical protein [Puniceicoccales bacterium]
MESYHFIDETGRPKGPVSEAELEKLAEAARQKGKTLLVAKVGDSSWQPWGKEAAASPAPTPASSPAPAQPRRPQAPGGVRPPASTPSGASAAPAAAAPVYAPAYAGPMYARPTPWIAFACYGAAALCSLALVALIVLTVVAATTKNAEMAALTGTSALLALPGCLLFVLSYVWMGKIISLLNEIASNTQRR